MRKIAVIGALGAVYSAVGREVLMEAGLVIGSKELLAANPLPKNAQTMVLDAEFKQKITKKLDEYSSGTVAILTSGDPLYCGLGAWLMANYTCEELVFYPGITAFQSLFAKLGQPWETAETCSVHCRPGYLPWRRLLLAPLAAVYGDARRPAAVLASELVNICPQMAQRSAAFGTDLGLSGEVIKRASLAEIASDPAAQRSLSVLVLLPDQEVKNSVVLPLGLPDEHYEHYQNMLTHSEVRAIVLAKLQLTSGVLWDIGAGSGSVGLEAAGLLPQLTVYAVEKHHERAMMLQNNLKREGLKNLKLVEAEAAEVLAELPRPERIFVGGGGRGLLEKLLEYLKPGGRLVISAVLLETVEQILQTKPEYRREFLQINISRNRPLRGGSGTIMTAENPVTLALFVKPEMEK